jgi:hypothetical protein
MVTTQRVGSAHVRNQDRGCRRRHVQDAPERPLTRIRHLQALAGTRPPEPARRSQGPTPTTPAAACQRHNGCCHGNVVPVRRPTGGEPRGWSANHWPWPYPATNSRWPHARRYATPAPQPVPVAVAPSPTRPGAKPNSCAQSRGPPASCGPPEMGMVQFAAPQQGDTTKTGQDQVVTQLQAQQQRGRNQPLGKGNIGVTGPRIA